MAAFRKGIHRVLVTSAADPALLLSQSDVIKFLNSHMELVNADESIATGLGFVANDGTDPMTTIADTLTAEEAFVILAGSERYASFVFFVRPSWAFFSHLVVAVYVKIDFMTGRSFFWYHCR